MAISEHAPLVMSIFRDAGFDAGVVGERIIVGLNRPFSLDEVTKVVYDEEIDELVKIFKINDNTAQVEVY